MVGPDDGDSVRPYGTRYAMVPVDGVLDWSAVVITNRWPVPMAGTSVTSRYEWLVVRATGATFSNPVGPYVTDCTRSDRPKLVPHSATRLPPSVVAVVALPSSATAAIDGAPYDVVGAVDTWPSTVICHISPPPPPSGITHCSCEWSMTTAHEVGVYTMLPFTPGRTPSM